MKTVAEICKAIPKKSALNAGVGETEYEKQLGVVQPRDSVGIMHRGDLSGVIGRRPFSRRMPVRERHRMRVRESQWTGILLQV